MPSLSGLAKKIAADRVLLLSLFLAFVFTLNGIDWGRVECWNPDEVALRPLFHKHKPPFEPSTFTKPPFHTYLTYFTVLKPIQIVESIDARLRKHNATPVDKNAFNGAILLGARLLTLALFLGGILLAYVIAHRFFGLLAARAAALLMATSAGFIAYNHYLTADSPMIFWMLLALFFCQRIVAAGALADYLLAGFFVGIGTATKYNALAAGLAIPVAHLLRSSSVRQAFLDYRPALGILMVPVAFIFGCPYAVLDHRRFIDDFMYNYVVTPSYGGQSGNSYGDFLARIPEIFGWPGSIWIALAIILSLVLVLARKSSAQAVRGFILIGSVLLLYYLKFGSFSRMETRFILPVMPFLLLLTGPLLEFWPRKPSLVFFTLAPILIYNCACSANIGFRFADDPRMAAQTWVQTELPAGASIESTQFCSNWNRLPGVHLDMRHAPNSNVRADLFARTLGGNPWIAKSLETREGRVNPADFTLAALQARNPEYLAVDSIAYAGVEPGLVKSYFTDILSGRYPYRIVFDLQNPPFPCWTYPSQLDFVENRITILRRIGGRNAPARQSEPEENE